MPHQWPPGYRIEPLDTKHDRSAFSSGVEALDAYLQRYARQDSDRDCAKTKVLVSESDGKIVGFYTLAMHGRPLEQLPDSLRGKVSRQPSVPVALIGRLAVDQTCHGRGFGTHLLTSAILDCYDASQTFGSTAILVDAKSESAKRFYEGFGFEALPDAKMRLILPMRTVKKAVAQGRLF